GRLPHPPVLLEPARELLGGLLRVEISELDLLVREQLACLELEQRADQHEEVAARVEVERLALGQALDEGDDDVRDVHVPGLQLLPQDEGQQEIERPLERVEVELQLADVHRREASGAGGRGRAAPPSRARVGSRAGVSPTVALPRGGRTATRRRTQSS